MKLLLQRRVTSLTLLWNKFFFGRLIFSQSMVEKNLRFVFISTDNERPPARRAGGENNQNCSQGSAVFTHLPRYNLLVNLNRLVSEEGRVTCSHFIDQNSQSPPVHGLVVTLKTHRRIRNQQQNYSVQGSKVSQWTRLPWKHFHWTQTVLQVTKVFPISLFFHCLLLRERDAKR